MASMPMKQQGIFLVFHRIFSPAEAPQWQLILCLFIASDGSSQMRLQYNTIQYYNESDTSVTTELICVLWSYEKTTIHMFLSVSQPGLLFINFHKVLVYWDFLPQLTCLQP